MMVNKFLKFHPKILSFFFISFVLSVKFGIICISFATCCDSNKIWDQLFRISSRSFFLNLIEHVSKFQKLQINFNALLKYSWSNSFLLCFEFSERDRSVSYLKNSRPISNKAVKEFKNRPKSSTIHDVDVMFDVFRVMVGWCEVCRFQSIWGMHMVWVTIVLESPITP